MFSGCTSGVRDDNGYFRKLPPDAGEKMLSYAAGLIETASPRDSGTVNAGIAAQWLASKLRSAGLKPQADTWREKTPYGEKTFSNIYADYGNGHNGLILLACHYDTKSGISDDFQGANDGASTCGILLGLAEHITRTSPKLRHKLRFAFFDGEECAGSSYRENDGLHGSRRMAENFAAGKYLDDVGELKAVIVIDMTGDKDLLLQLPRNVSPTLAKVAIESSIENPEAARVSLARTYIIDDHWPFVERGYTAIDLIDFEYGSAPGLHDYWHTEHDTIDKLSAKSLRETAILVLEIVSRIEEGYLDRDKDAPAGEKWK